jgi:putative glutamine amidotransferase
LKKKIAISMRVETNQRREERADVIDQRLISFIAKLGLEPIPIPNLGMDVPEWLSTVAPEGIVLSGGNDLCIVGGDAPERDAGEVGILEWASSRHLPVLGICRGMQMIATVNGAKLDRRANHAGVEHDIHGTLSGRVLSHHLWCIPSPPKTFEVLAYADDGSVEAIASTDHRILGIMWHPERMTKMQPVGFEWIARTLGGCDLR